MKKLRVLFVLSVCIVGVHLQQDPLFYSDCSLCQTTDTGCNITEKSIPPDHSRIQTTVQCRNYKTNTNILRNWAKSHTGTPVQNEYYRRSGVVNTGTGGQNYFDPNFGTLPLFATQDSERAYFDTHNFDTGESVHKEWLDKRGENHDEVYEEPTPAALKGTVYGSFLDDIKERLNRLIPDQKPNEVGNNQAPQGGSQLEENPVRDEVPNRPINSEVPNRPINTEVPNRPTINENPNRPINSLDLNRPAINEAVNRPINTEVPYRPTINEAPNRPTNTQVLNRPTNTEEQNRPNVFNQRPNFNNPVNNPGSNPFDDPFFTGGSTGFQPRPSIQNRPFKTQGSNSNPFDDPFFSSGSQFQPKPITGSSFGNGNDPFNSPFFNSGFNSRPGFGSNSFNNRPNRQLGNNGPFYGSGFNDPFLNYR